MKRVLVIEIQAVNVIFRRVINEFPLLGGKPTRGQEGNVRLESDNPLQPRSGATSTRRPAFNRSPHFFQELGSEGMVTRALMRRRVCNCPKKS